MARASILWLIGEYCHLIPKIAPDVLRKAAKSFTAEVSEVGLHCVVYYITWLALFIICKPNSQASNDLKFA